MSVSVGTAAFAAAQLSRPRTRSRPEDMFAERLAPRAIGSAGGRSVLGAGGDCSVVRGVLVVGCVGAARSAVWVCARAAKVKLTANMKGRRTNNVLRLNGQARALYTGCGAGGPDGARATSGTEGGTQAVAVWRAGAGKGSPKPRGQHSYIICARNQTRRVGRACRRITTCHALVRPQQTPMILPATPPNGRRVIFGSRSRRR